MATQEPHENIQALEVGFQSLWLGKEKEKKNNIKIEEEYQTWRETWIAFVPFGG